jgi:hypothetical protein
LERRDDRRDASSFFAVIPTFIAWLEEKDTRLHDMAL